jgi:hypothetical protein
MDFLYCAEKYRDVACGHPMAARIAAEHPFCQCAYFCVTP